jgi:twitching motility two-component system response regulator PilG
MRKKILVLDSSETIRKVCGNLLTQQGYEPVLHERGEGALAEMRKTEFDLAIVATDTEGMSGHEVVTEMRKEKGGKRLPVLLLIGSAELMDTNELFSAEPDMTLNKPFSPQELMMKVDQLLAQPQESEKKPQDDEYDIEQILSEDRYGIDKELDDAAEQAFLGLLADSDSDTDDSDAPHVDKMELTEEPEAGSEIENDFDSDNTPHDYAWFVREMGSNSAVPPKPKKKKPTPPVKESDSFDVEEIGSSNLWTKAAMEAGPESFGDTDKIYIETPLGVSEAPAGERIEEEKIVPDAGLAREFVRILAEAIAREIASQIDLRRLTGRLEQLLSETIAKETASQIDLDRLADRLERLLSETKGA